MKKFVKVTAVALVAVMALALLVACGPASDPDKALAALKENGYTATKVSAGSYEGLTAVVTGTKGLLSGLLGGGDVQFITIFYFESSKAANEAWADIQEVAGKDSNKKDDSDWVVEKSGSMIYYGTKQAVKDAR